MKYCSFCELPVDETNPATYREVTSWVHGPKLDGPVLREQTGRFGHAKCVEHLVHGQAPDQDELIDETGEPLLTDEPGKVTKLTGPNSVHEALTSRVIRKQEDDDDFPI